MGHELLGPAAIRSPIDLRPPIRTYQSNAYALGALLTVGGRASCILDNHFIALGCVSDIKTALRPILFLPFMSPDSLSELGLGTAASFKAMLRSELARAIVSSLRRGFLVKLAVDEFHIPERRVFRTRHQIHDVLVTAATPDAARFELLGYCADRRYRPSPCTLEQLSEAYFSAMGQTGQPGFLAFKAEVPQPIAVDLPAIKRQLECFLDSRGSAAVAGAFAQKSPGPILHGLAVFDALDRYARSLTPTEWLDRRVFSLLAEHSEMMLRRTATVERLLEVQIPRGPAERAVKIGGQLKLLSLLPEPRRGAALFEEMAGHFARLRAEIRNAAEVLLEPLEACSCLSRNVAGAVS